MLNRVTADFSVYFGLSSLTVIINFIVHFATY
jgi:hypothetical protein